MTTLLQLGVTGAFFCIKQTNCAILAIEQLPYNAKSQNSEESGYFEEVFLLKQQQKHASSFFNLQALDRRAWKVVFMKFLGKKATNVP